MQGGEISFRIFVSFCGPRNSPLPVEVVRDVTGDAGPSAKSLQLEFWLGHVAREEVELPQSLYPHACVVVNGVKTLVHLDLQE